MLSATPPGTEQFSASTTLYQIMYILSFSLYRGFGASGLLQDSKSCYRPVDVTLSGVVVYRHAARVRTSFAVFDRVVAYEHRVKRWRPVHYRQGESFRSGCIAESRGHGGACIHFSRYLSSVSKPINIYFWIDFADLTAAC